MKKGHTYYLETRDLKLIKQKAALEDKSESAVLRTLVRETLGKEGS
jgi:hypothetical protein